MIATHLAPPSVTRDNLARCPPKGSAGEMSPYMRAKHHFHRLSFSSESGALGPRLQSARRSLRQVLRAF